MTGKLVPVELFQQGYTDLVSVIPLDATLSPASKISADQLGKVPGRRFPSGMWAGYNWRAHTPAEDDVRRWAIDGANIGLRAKHFPGLDIDSLDPKIAGAVEQIAVATLGPAPVRIGRAPKRLLMYRTDTPFSRMRLWITGDDNVQHLVELLGDGQQYLVHGTHPGTRKPYTWAVPIREAAALTTIDAAKVNELFQRLVEYFEAMGYNVRREGTGAKRERTVAVQSDLFAPSIDALREAVAHIPNNDELFPGRDEYIRMGYAIRAAGGADDDEAYPIFAGWAAKHEADGRVEGNPETWRSDWRRMLPPFSVGWEWIAGLARAYGYSDAASDFKPVEMPAPKQEEEAAPRAALTDIWLVEQVINRLRDRLRFVPQTGRWLVWDGTRWHHDELLRAQALITDTLLAISREHCVGKAAKEARRVESAGTLMNVMRMVRADASIAVLPSSMDGDPWMLNTPSGVVDLRNGMLRPPESDLLMTKRTRVGPDFGGACPEWKRFLAEATGNNRELEAYLQRLAGYALTGVTSEAMVAFVWGPGGNGKSVFLNAIRDVMGDYAQVASMDTFTSAFGERHPTDLADLMGARMVTASETQSGRRWDEQRIKALTGNEPVKARFMRQDFFTFQPTFKLIFSGNHMPNVRDVDPAMRRRLQMVPFTVTPAQIDLQLGEKLKAEYPAILAWMIEGCLAWLAQGIAQPAAVQGLTDDYLEDEDALGMWMHERCEADADAVTLSADLYESWREWAGARGEFVGSHKRFAMSLRSRGMERVRGENNYAAYKGLKLNKVVFP